MYEILIC